jgi:hypothetical protein
MCIDIRTEVEMTATLLNRDTFEAAMNVHVLQANLQDVAGFVVTSRA